MTLWELTVPEGTVTNFERRGVRWFGDVGLILAWGTAELQKNRSTVISSGGIIRPSASTDAKRDIVKFETLQSSPAPAMIGGGL
jgi:hypothetical protein